MIFAHGFYVIDAWITILLGLAGIAILSYFVLRGPAQQSLVLSALATLVGVPLLYLAYYISFQMETVHERAYLHWMSGFACGPFILGCIGLSLRLGRRKH